MFRNLKYIYVCKYCAHWIYINGTWISVAQEYYNAAYLNKNKQFSVCPECWKGMRKMKETPKIDNYIKVPKPFKVKDIKKPKVNADDTRKYSTVNIKS